MIDPAQFHTIRRRELRSRMLGTIQRFVRRYDPTSPTLLLLPGTMGSQLERSEEPIEHFARRPLIYDTVWLDGGALFGDIEHLAIDAEGRDAGGHLVVPSGPLRSILTPYGDTWSYCRRRKLNFVVFAFDWRRSLAEAAKLLEWFVDELIRRVIKAHGAAADPRPGMTIACHSLGGLVGLLFLHRLQARASDDAPPLPFYRMVTIGAPFYGAAHALEYYYSGVPILNRIYGADKITRVIGSFPGTPILHFLDQATYRTYCEAYQSRGEEPELPRYPCREAACPETDEIDPFGEPALPRYPTWKVTSHLKNAQTLRHAMHAPLADTLLDRFFNLRVASLETCTEIHWHDCDARVYSPDSALPIAPTIGIGDGSIPAWSARYCRTPRSHTFDIATQTRHESLMEDERVLFVLESIIREGKLPSNATPPDPIRNRRPMKPNAIAQMADDIASRTADPNDPRFRRRTFWRSVLAEISWF